MRAPTTTGPLLIAAAAAAAALAACARGVPSPATADEAGAIRAARLEQNAAIARRDFARVASYWTEDVTIRAGLGRSLDGREAYRAALAADSATRYVRTPTEIVVSGRWPLAYESGRWAGTPAAGGAAPMVGGRYSAQWVKAGDGRWLIRSEVFVALDCSGTACGRPAVAPP